MTRYPLTFYVKSLPPGVGGEARGPVIRILEKYRNDQGIYAHELMHVKQWFFTLGLHSLRYLFSPRYKLACEVEAYREQARHYPDDRLPRFAQYISERYGLKNIHRVCFKIITRRIIYYGMKEKVPYSL